MFGALVVSTAPGGSTASASGSTTVQVAMGSEHVVAIGTDGSVSTWGSLVPGPTGVGSKDALTGPTTVTLPGARTAVDVAATYNASFAVAADGTVWAWGSLGRGLGDSANTTDTRYTTPVQVAFPAGVLVSEVSAACEGVMARTSTGDVYQWGAFYGNWQMSYATPTKLSSVTGASSISRGCSTSFAVLSNGTALAWGANGGGRLGDGTTTDRPTPVTISLPNGRLFSRISTSSSHALAVATDGSLFGWGGNSNGQLAADPNALSFSASPRAIAIGSTTAVAASATDSSPFSVVVTAASTVLKWGGWNTSDYSPTAMSLPTTDIASRTLRGVTTYYSAAIFVANDGSLWAKGWWGSADVDGNCGANASDWPTWRDGTTIPARPLVRTISRGQFGSAYTEDQLSLAKMETGIGAALPLDGSGTAVATVGVPMTVVATAPRSACYGVDQLTYQFSDDNGATWTTDGVTTSTNAFAQTVVTISYTPASSGRKRAQFRIVNPDGRTASYRFAVGVAAASSGGGGGGSPSALPIVDVASDTVVAIGTDRFLYAWGAGTAITGGSGSVVEPVRVRPSVDVDQAFKSIAIASRAASSYAAAAVSENGRLYVWGSASADLVLGGTSAVAAPTELAMPSGKSASKVFLGTRDICSPDCVTGIYGLVIDSDGVVYAWGGGVSDELSWSSGFGASVSVVPSMAGYQIENVRILGEQILLRTVSGELYNWSVRRTCSGSCAWSSPVFLLRVGQKFGYGSHSVPGSGSSTNGVYEITGAGGVSYTSVDLSSGAVGSARSIDVPGARTAVDIQVVGSTPVIVTNDGQVWFLYSWGSYMWRYPLEAAPISRFASTNGRFVVGQSGSLWGLSTPSGITGTCAVGLARHESSTMRVKSSGQFGSVFTQDSFAVALDSPNYVWLNHATYPGTPGEPRVSDERSRELQVRPGATVRLYTYVRSSCVGVSDLSVSWDLDDDGDFETTGTVGAVTDRATSLTTPYSRVRINSDDENWDGIVQADYRESFVDITAASPSGSLEQGGGRFISVKYRSARGAAVQKYALVVQPTKPSGRVGVTVNSGARFTDSTEVTLGMVWPDGTTTALISNDGGFSDVQEVPVSPTIRWTLPSGGSGLLSSTVYVRFKSLQTDWSSGGWSTYEPETNYTDDIVLDLRPPDVTSVSASSSSSSSSLSSSSVRSSNIVRSSAQTAIVSLTASDAVSGIAGVQITTDPAVPGPVRAFSRQYTIPVDRGKVAVRAKDNVGHWSPWSYAQVSGFTVVDPPAAVTPQIPAPQNPVNPPASVVTERPAAITAPVAQAPEPVASVPTPAVAPTKPTASSSKPTVVARRNGTTATLAVTLPASSARVCSTKTVKGKKSTTCGASTISVAVKGKTVRTVKARAGTINLSVRGVKKGTKVTVRLNGKALRTLTL